MKGFGVTLTIGLLANMFTAVFVTRLMFDWLVTKGWLKSFKMLHVFRHLPHINFLGVWKLAFLLSWVFIGAGMWSFVHRGGLARRRRRSVRHRFQGRRHGDDERSPSASMRTRSATRWNAAGFAESTSNINAADGRRGSAVA